MSKFIREIPIVEIKAPWLHMDYRISLNASLNITSRIESYLSKTQIFSLQ